MRSGTTTVRVRYAETDQQGVAHHAAYLVWMEIARSDMMRELGFPYDRLESEGLLFAVSEATCRYAAPVRYEEQVEIEAWCRAVRSRAVIIDYAFRVRGREVAAGSTTLVALDAGRRPRRIPEALARALGEGGPSLSAGSTV